MTLDRDALLLKDLPIFSAFGMEQLRMIAFGADTIDVAEKTVLFREGDEADNAYVLIEGELFLTSSETGKETLIQDRGAMIGELALLAPNVRPMTAAAVTNCRLMVLSRKLFRKLLEEYPAMAEVLQIAISERLHELSNDLRRLHPKFAI